MADTVLEAKLVVTLRFSRGDDSKVAIRSSIHGPLSLHGFDREAWIGGIVV